MKNLVLFSLAICFPFILACASLNKIHFDISQINSDGLVGLGDGLHSVSYEFCIPAQEKFLKEVQAIAPTVQFSHSRGRIGCQHNQYLCIVDTHHPQWRETLLRLAKLSYIERIEQTFWE